MDRKTFLKYYRNVRFQHERLKGTLSALYVLVTEVKDEDEAKVVDNILNDYVISWQRVTYLDRYSSVERFGGIRTISCLSMPIVLAKAVIESATKILEAKKLAEEEKQNPKVQKHIDDLCK